jgi:mono/diheme cytochrome c family protein
LFLRVAGSAVLVLATGAPPCFGGEDANESPAAAPGFIDYSRDIRPIFQSHCYDCHGPDLQESNYRLDQKGIAFAGGDHGAPPIVAGKSADSPLFKFVARTDVKLQMPPKDQGRPLSVEEISLLRAWIDQGAAWPDDGKERSAESRPTTDHWSFQPIANVKPPKSSEPWAASAIDAFVLAKLHGAGLTPSPPADRVSLIRRMYFDMHGLPPTPDEVAAFVKDERPDAYMQLVDKVLASPRYGERWAQHWLDVVRFAESNGFEMNTERNNAWPYRDYVIVAFNDDKPYDRFVMEQLAGDALGEPAATGFLVAGPWDQVKSPDPTLTLAQRQDELADMVGTTGTAFLGLTVGCARCHNHKFDPILQKDYYSLQAVFVGVQHGERQLVKAASPGADGLREAVTAGSNEERFPAIVASSLRFIIRATNNNTEPCLDELEVWSVASEGLPSSNVARAEAGGRPTSSGDYPGNPKHALSHVNDGKYGNDWSWISSTPSAGHVQVDFGQPVAINRVVWGRDRLGGYTDRLPTDYSIEVLDQQGEWREIASSANRRPIESEAPMVYAGQFTQPEQPTHRLYRGDPMSPREVVAPDALSILGSLGLKVDSQERDRRLALAHWIASADNPLTARVVANRIWQHHFGTGLVDTPSDFGANGGRPSHPELLDWLAHELIEHGWSIKHIQRLILLSNTFQQASAPRSECLTVDVGTRLLWRFPPRRLEAEAIRDSILQIAGSLDLIMGGPGWRPFKPNDNYVRVYEPKEEFGPPEWRRAVYMQRIRMRPEGVFGAFDAPDGGQVCPRRTRSITALQALNLFNSSFTVDEANQLATRLVREAGSLPNKQIARAFELAFSRQPDEAELDAATRLVRQFGLPAFCRAILNSNELMFIP